ncbi:MAG: hypothetical protein AAGF23_19030 [Acidobacteriota bacterium]
MIRGILRRWLAIFAATGLGWPSISTAAPPTSAAGGGGDKSPREALFVDATDRLGVSFGHRVFPSGQKDMPENMGAGLAVFDADADGRLDLFFVQGAPVRGGGGAAAGAHRLFVQGKSGTFTGRTVRSQAAAAGGVGMGVCVGDADADGDPHL